MRSPIKYEIHTEDKEALKELKLRPKQNVITIPANINTEEQEQIFKQAISNIESN